MSGSSSSSSLGEPWSSSWPWTLLCLFGRPPPCPAVSPGLAVGGGRHASVEEDAAICLHCVCCRCVSLIEFWLFTAWSTANRGKNKLYIVWWCGPTQASHPCCPATQDCSPLVGLTTPAVGAAVSPAVLTRAPLGHLLSEKLLPLQARRHWMLRPCLSFCAAAILSG